MEKAQCLNELIGPVTTKSKKKAESKKENLPTTEQSKYEERIFKWMMQHQEAFAVLKGMLSIASQLELPRYFQ